MMRKVCLWAVLMTAFFFVGCVSMPENVSMVIDKERQIKSKIDKHIRERVIKADQDKKVRISGKNYHIELKNISVVDLVGLIYGEVLKYPYVIEASDEIKAKICDVAIKKEISKSELYQVGVRVLERIGLYVEDRGGVLYVFGEDRRPEKDKVIAVHMKLKNVNSAELAEVLGAHVSDKEKKIFISADKGRDLVLSGYYEDVQRLARIAKSLDVKKDQIYAEVEIYEASMIKELKYGLEAYLEKTVGNVLVSAENMVESVTGPGAFRALVNIDDRIKTDFSIFQRRGLVRIVAKPQIVCEDGKEAIVRVGSDVPILGGTVITDSTATQNITYRSTGVNLTVKPVLLDDGQIYLDLSVDLSKSGRNSDSNIDSPSISQRSVITRCRVGNGQRLIIAGLIQNDDETNISELPGNNLIKKLGQILGKQSKTENKTEIIIMVRPYVINQTENILDRIIEKYEMLKSAY